MILLRKEAIILSSFIHFLNLPASEKSEIIESEIIEEATEEVSNFYGRKHVVYAFKSFTNQYLALYLTAELKKEVRVKGRQPRLYPCPCCGYKTLSSRAHYDICAVCFWEDDGENDPSKLSSVNHMHLGEARLNFLEIGVMQDFFLIAYINIASCVSQNNALIRQIRMPNAHQFTTLVS